MQYRHEWKHEISVFDVLCLRIAGGGITVNSCSEGIESPEIFIEDGDITVTSTDDGINAWRHGDRRWQSPRRHHQRRNRNAAESLRPGRRRH